jgi:hypothetical protein
MTASNSDRRNSSRLLPSRPGESGGTTRSTTIPAKNAVGLPFRRQRSHQTKIERALIKSAELCVGIHVVKLKLMDSEVFRSFAAIA